MGSVYSYWWRFLSYQTETGPTVRALFQFIKTPWLEPCFELPSFSIASCGHRRLWERALENSVPIATPPQHLLRGRAAAIPHPPHQAEARSCRLPFLSPSWTTSHPDLAGP